MRAVWRCTNSTMKTHMHLRNVISIQTCDPVQFFSEHRMDLVCKYALFRDLHTKKHDDFVWDLYRQHIVARNGGVEPEHCHNTKTIAKNSIDDFMYCAKELYHSMSTQGFDPEYPVPYTLTGVLLNGAHRLGCAAALGISVVTACIRDNRHKGTPWNTQWFSDNNFTTKQIDYITDLLQQITTKEPK